jgi:hypothetical protein
VALLGSYRARVHNGWLMVDYRRAVHEPQVGPMVNHVHFPHSLSWFTVDQAHRAAASLFSSPWAILRARRCSRRACGGHGPRREGGILPLFYMARCALLRWPSPAPPCPARWSGSYETDAPRRRHGHGISGKADAPCGHPFSSPPIFKGTPCLAAWQGLQRVFPSLYRAVAGGTASPWPGSGHGERARRSHVQPAFLKVRWLSVAPFLTAVCARTCVVPRLRKRPCLGRLQYGGAMAGATDLSG